MARRAEEIKGLVGPVQEKLGRMEGEIGRLERERRQAQGELAQMLRQLGDGVGTLRQETGNLVSALKRPSHARLMGGDPAAQRGGDGGDGLPLRLRRAEHDSDRRRARCGPDMLVRLPGGKLVVVDSKVPLDAYLSALEAEDEDARELHIARHARQTREHIAKLAAKSYQRQFDSTPEFVVMFVPSDGIYQAALAQDPALIEFGVQQQVLMATPTTLDRAAVGGALRLAPGADRAVRARDRRVCAGASPPARSLRGAVCQGRAPAGLRDHPPTTRRSAPSSTG